MSITAEGSNRPQRIALIDDCRDAHEAMRFLPAGKYVITAPAVERLIVRAIPELIYAYYHSNPLVTEYGKYVGAFSRKYVYKNITTFTGSNRVQWAGPWAKRGKRYLGHYNFIRWFRKEGEKATAEECYEQLAKHPALAKREFAGVVINEFGNSDKRCVPFTYAVKRLIAEGRLKGRAIYPYVRSLWDGPDGMALLRAVMKHNGAVFVKRYLKEQANVADAWRFLNDSLLDPIQGYREHCPGSEKHVIVCFGIFSGPPESLDTFPHVNHKVHLDMQFNIVANDPTFDGIRGLMSYAATWSEEETLRWVMRLFRHYGIEGNTGTLGSDPYILPHIENGDFEREGQGWDVFPAAEGSIRFGVRPGFGAMQARYPRPPEGDTVLITKRAKKKPNVFSQEIKDLEPGRLYSFRMYSGDFEDMTTEEKHAVTIRLDNVELLPKRCFTHVFHNHPNAAHSQAPYDGREKKAWMNYHLRVFRAKGKTARLTVSDWASEKEARGTIGQELMFNFVQVQPYLSD